ncbi:hypothetical protein BOTNAR_0671g00050 [Botryotinia narcissicola]|uniref:Uncharacterized protein n=1 Tax=Botryotinia narcissicola TaxID=278944 RepID=A0A4Z1H8H8_9HELO|nr:hypothetical protein BOTNAR_0671g00050 [Botryotinia narcissicola]
MVLKDLSSMEQSFIARGHPIGSVVKLDRTENKKIESMATISLVGNIETGVEEKCMLLPRAVIQNTVAGVGIVYARQ